MYFCYFLSGYLGKIISSVPPGPLSGPPSVILWPTQCPPEAFLALPHHRLQCSSWPPTTIPSLQKLIHALSARRNYKMYLSKLINVFVQIAKYFCVNSFPCWPPAPTIPLLQDFLLAIFMCIYYVHCTIKFFCENAH